MGGTFVNQNPADGDDHLGGSFVADGYHVETQTQSNGDVWFIVKKNAEPKEIGKSRYTGDVTLNESIISKSGGPMNCATIFAVGENTNVTVEGGEYRNASKYAADCILASGGATVTVNGGTFDGGSGASDTAVYVKYGAKVVINNGYFTVGADENNSGNSVVYVEDGEVEINGGFFETDYDNGNGFFYVINVYNDSTNYKVTVKGGTFVNYDPSKGDDHLGGNFVADGYKVVSKTVGKDTWYTVVKE